MKICLVRHGETAWNAEQRLQGWLDIPLNAAGEAQARSLAAELADTAFDAVYSSPLQRALVTAQAVVGEGRRIQQDVRLRERNFGELQGQTRGEIAASFPALHAELQARRPGFRPPGGEAMEDFASRVRSVFEELRRRHHGEQLLVVAHGGVLDVVYRLASDQDLHSPRLHALPNAAINWLRVTPRGWAVDAWGLDGHLSGARDEL